MTVADFNSDLTMDDAIVVSGEKLDAIEAERRDNVAQFVRTNPDLYASEFKKIGSQSGFTVTFNFFAALFGPIWFGARGLWKWAVGF